MGKKCLIEGPRFEKKGLKPILKVESPEETKLLWVGDTYIEDVLAAIKATREALDELNRTEKDDVIGWLIYYEGKVSIALKAISRAFYSFSRKRDFHAERIRYNKAIDEMNVSEVACLCNEVIDLITNKPTLAKTQLTADGIEALLERFIELTVGDVKHHSSDDSLLLDKQIEAGVIPATRSKTPIGLATFDRISLTLEDKVEATEDDLRTLRTNESLALVRSCAREALKVLPQKPKFRRLGTMYLTCYDERIRNFFHACMQAGLYDPKARWLNDDFRCPSATHIEAFDAKKWLSLMTFWADKASFWHWSLQRVIDSGDLERLISRYLELDAKSAFCA